MKLWRSSISEDWATGQAAFGSRLQGLPPGHLQLVTAHDVQELRSALAKNRLPADLAAKLARLSVGSLSERYVEQNSQLFFALLLAALESEFTEATLAQRERLLRVLAYVRKDDDAIPDYLPGGFFDDHQEVRAAARELAHILHAFKAWRLRHQVPGMWRG